MARLELDLVQPRQQGRVSGLLMLENPALIPWLYAGYSLLAFGLGRMSPGFVKDLVFAGMNLFATLAIFFVLPGARYGVFVVYVLAVCGSWLVMRLTARREGWLPWLGFFAPILLLVGVRAVPLQFLSEHSATIARKLSREPDFSLPALFLGLSYLAFRTSRLVIEVRNGVAPMPNLVRYLGFVFFLPVMPVGPIHTWKDHALGLDGKAERPPVGRCLARIAVGLAKYLFVGGLFNQLAYSQLVLDGRLHGWGDLAIACVCYYLFLYFNFSGACDAAIGIAGLAGIPVPENFDSPLAARNLRDFWNRWHITLGEYMRDIVFAPLSKKLVSAFGVKKAHHALAVTILVVFLLIGIWHGTGWRYVLFGLLHALGVIANHYYGIWLKRRLSVAVWKRYHASGLVRGIATMTTFAYVALTVFLFANSPEEMRDISSTLR
jgi:membrane protein involved in D-alanine export